MKPSQPFISVIIPSFNRAALLAETLESVLRQDYDQWEAIVVDDGSTDRNREVVAGITARDGRIRFLDRQEQPRGAPVCRNTGVRNAKGDFLIFLDSDDLLMPFALSQRASVILAEPGLDFWVFPILMFRDDPALADHLWNTDNGQPDLSRFLRLDAPWQTSGPVWRKEAAERIGGYTPGLTCWQDVDFHLKALIAGLKGRKFYDLPPDVCYRQHGTESISQGEISSPEKLESRRDIFLRTATSLLPRLDSAMADDLAILGGNIAIGAAKALNAAISLSVIRFGRKHGIFSSQLAARLRMVLLFYLLRLDRIPAFGSRIRRLTNPFRQDSNIGKHLYAKNQANERQPAG